MINLRHKSLWEGHGFSRAAQSLESKLDCSLYLNQIAPTPLSRKEWE